MSTNEDLARDDSPQPSKDRGQHTAKLRHDEAAVSIPHNRLGLVFPSLMLCVFLAALDSTITAVAAPAICRELGCSSADFQWLASSYLLGSAAFMPMYGRLSDIVGRKPVMYSGILLFLLGSGLCGGAKNIRWMIGCRAIQGVGGGAIMSLTQVIISDIVTLQDRGRYASFLGSVWGIASVLGPLFGGFIVNGGRSFAWCFWLNLPTGGVAIVTLAIFLNLNPVQPKPLSWHLRTFDFPGLFLLTTGVICLLLGFAQAQTLGWQAAATIALVAVGGICILSAIVWDCFTTRQPIIPPRLFRNRTTAALLFGCLMHGISFFAGAFYTVSYFQGAKGDSALLSAVEMLPYSLVSSLFSITAGQFVSRTGRWKWLLCSSWALWTVGMGLMTLIDARSPKVEVCMFLLIQGIAIGGLFQVPLIGLQAAMPISDMATSTGAFVLIRTIGTTLGASVGGLIFTLETMKRLEQIPGYTPPPSISEDLSGLVHIPDPVIRGQVLEAYASGIRYIWIVMIPLLGLSFFASLGIREYSLKTNQVKAAKSKGGEPSPPADIENGGTSDIKTADIDGDDEKNGERMDEDEAKEVELVDREKQDVDVPKVVTV